MDTMKPHYGCDQAKSHGRSSTGGTVCSPRPRCLAEIAQPLVIGPLVFWSGVRFFRDF
jgi:hypothetical protein